MVDVVEEPGAVLLAPMEILVEMIIMDVVGHHLQGDSVMAVLNHSFREEVVCPVA